MPQRPQILAFRSRQFDPDPKYLPESSQYAGSRGSPVTIVIISMLPKVHNA